MKAAFKDCATSKGTIRYFQPSKPLPPTLVKELIKARNSKAAR